MESYLHVTSRVILLVLVVTYSSGQSASTEWTSTPTTTVQACIGRNVTLTWEFRTDEEIQVLFWGRPSTGEFDLIFYYDDEEQKIAGRLNDRIHVMEHSLDTIEFLLVNISEDDEGKYQLLVAGPGLRNEIDLQVYEDFELEPSIAIANRPYPHDSPFNLTVGDYVIMTVASRDFPGYITIQTADSVVQTCINQTFCIYALTDQTEVVVLVDYGFCEPPPSLIHINWYQTHTYKTVTHEGQEGGVSGARLEETTIEGAKLEGTSPAVAIIVTVLVLLVLALVAVCIVFILLRWKPEEKRTTRDKKYLEFVGGIHRHLTCGKDGQISQDRALGDGTEEEATETPMLPGPGIRESEAMSEQETVQKYREEDECLPVHAANDSRPQVGGDVADEETTQTPLLPEARDETLPVRAANDSRPQVGGDVADEETTQTPLLPVGTEALPKQENVQKYGVEDETLPVGAVNDSRPEVTDDDIVALFGGLTDMGIIDAFSHQGDEKTNAMLPQEQQNVLQYWHTEQIIEDEDEEEVKDSILEDDDDDPISPGKVPTQTSKFQIKLKPAAFNPKHFASKVDENKGESKVQFTLKPAAFNPKHFASKVDENKGESDIAGREAGSDSLRDTCDVPFTELDVCVGDADATAKEGVQPKQVGRLSHVLW